MNFDDVTEKSKAKKWGIPLAVLAAVAAAVVLAVLTGMFG